MSDRLGLARLGEPGEVFLGRDFARSQDYSETTSAAIDEEIRSLLTIAEAEARKIVDTHRDALEAMADALIANETLDKDEIAELFDQIPKWVCTFDTSRGIEPVHPDNVAELSTLTG